jgi:DNA-binding GntR family transcriptional regulator
MQLENQQGQRWPAPLAGRVADGADAEQVADAIVAVWQEIDQALHPIIGHRGVAALFSRSLSLTAAAYPWLAIGQPAVPAAIDPSGLRAALMQQAAAEAAAGGNALFHRFHELLASLVGPSLTERLLRSVWAHPSGTSSAQDTNP